MQRSARNNRRRQSLWFERFEPRQLLAGLDGYEGEVYGPLPAPALELPQTDAVPFPVSSLAGDDAAWMRAEGLTGRGQTVALIDSGIAYDHVALGGGIGAGFKVEGGWDFAENDGDPYDDGPAGFHGTHVAGIIGGNDGVHFGVAPDVSLVALRVFTDSGATQASWIESALRWVHEHRFDYAAPITAVNLSIGTAGEGAESALRAALDDELALLRGDGIFVAVSAGNRFAPQRATDLSYPASSPWVTPVASANAEGGLSDFSQRNGRVLVAPGENIVSTAPDYLLGADGRYNDYVAATGTSMAAPQVAAASVLVRQALRQVEPGEPQVERIEQALRDGADLVFDPTTHASYARLNLGRTLQQILSSHAIAAVVPATSNVAGSPWPAGAAWTLDQDASPKQESWHTWDVVHTGFVTLQAVSASPDGDSLVLEAYDAQGQRRAASRRMPDGSVRLDLTAQAGEKLSFALHRPSAAVEIRLTNLVFQDGDQLHIYGTSGDDRLRISVDDAVRVQLHDVAYQFPLAETHYVDFAGMDGRDEAVIDSQEFKGAARAILTSLDAQVQMRALTIRVANVDDVRLRAGARRDEAMLVDGLSDDRFRLAAGETAWTTATGTIQLAGYDDVTVLATRGGNDTADLVDSPRDDCIDVRAGEVRWNVGGTAYVLRGLERLDAASSQGGLDAAILHDVVASKRLATSGFAVIEAIEPAAASGVMDAMDRTSRVPSEPLGAAETDRVRAIDYLYRKLGR